MDENTKNLRVKYILVRYNFEKEKLNVAQRLMLLDNWIASCTKFEEYEMAQALVRLKDVERKNLQKLVRNKRPRTFIQVIKLRLKILYRRWLT